MSGIAWVVLSGLAVLIIGIIAALVTPVRLRFAARSKPRWRMMLSARLFGGLTPPLRIIDSARPRRRVGKPALQPSKRTGSKTSFGGRASRALFAAPRLLISLLRPVRLDRLAIDADVGLSDPADTGQLVGMLNPLIYALPKSDAVHIAVRPDFSGTRLEGDLEADVSFVPAALVPPLAAFAWRVLRTR